MRRFMIAFFCCVVFTASALAEPADAVAFLGDSITWQCDWDTMFNGVKSFNGGLQGDTAAGMLTRLDEIEKLNPRKIFLMIGINDLSKGAAPKDIAASYRALLERLAKLEAEVYVESVLPVNMEIIRQHGSYTVDNRDVQTLNAYIEGLADEFGVTYVDVYSPFLDQGVLCPTYTIDGLHLSEEGYGILADSLEPYIAP